MLAQLAHVKGKRPDEILRSHADDYAEALYAKLFRDLYENVFIEAERDLLFACSLYRNGLHYSHLPRLEAALGSTNAGASLVRRRLLTEDADWLYLHDLAAEQARKLAPGEVQTRSLQSQIASFWLTDIQGQHVLIEANIRRALEALHHLEQAGEGERVTEIAPELFGRRPDEAATALWRLEERLNSESRRDSVGVILEYLLKVSPNDHKAMRFLGEYRRKRYGQQDQQALSLFRNAIRIHPAFPHYWANYGHASIVCGACALAEFLERIQSAPPHAINDHVAAIYATALQAAGRGDEASQLRQDKINARSGNAAFYNDEAKWLLDVKHDPEGALAVLDKARRQGSANEYTEAIYATALQAAGRGDEASQLRQDKINARSGHAVFYSDEAKWLLDVKHDPEGALAVLDKARRQGCANEFTEAIYATALQAAGRGDEASQLRQDKINARSGHAVFYSDEAKWLLDVKHDPEGALAVLDKARRQGCANEYTEAIYATALKAAPR